MFALASLMGARAGELLALTVPDLDFERKTIRVNKSADDRTRVIRQPKTKKSVALLPMPSSLEALLRNYLKHHWKENPGKLLFPAPRKEGFAYSRNNVVRSGLKPILRKLGIPEKTWVYTLFDMAWQQSWRRVNLSPFAGPDAACRCENDA
jgi:integrase